MPYLRGLDSADSDGADPSAVLGAVQDAIETVLPARSSGTPGAPSPAPGRANAADQPWLVMRQQLFCNASLAHATFEAYQCPPRVGGSDRASGRALDSLEGFRPPRGRPVPGGCAGEVCEDRGVPGPRRTIRRRLSRSTSRC